MAHNIVARDELPQRGSAHRFEGYLYGDADVSFFLSEMPPGKGPRLHAHPYQEVFVVQEGALTFTVGDAAVEAPSGRMTTEWLDDERSDGGTGGGST